MKGLTSSVDKTFAILEYFTVKKPEWSITELTEAIDSNKSTVHRFLNDMKKWGVIYQNPNTGRYSLGFKLFELGNRVEIQSAFVDKTHPILVEVAKKITETVHIAILKNNQTYYVDKVESPQGLRLNTSIGTYYPAYATSLGKVLLAHNYLNYEDLKSQEPFNSKLQSYTDNTITDSKKLAVELEKIRNQNYAIDYEEFEIGLICVGVPVFNQEGQIVASLSAAGPANRFKENELNNYVKILQEGAAAIQKEIKDFKFQV
ncbi:MAG: IclR family transcriptional regulator [Flavobacteriales bacterium]